VSTTTVESELEALEPLFHRFPPGTSRENVELLIGEDFWEVGASGSIYHRDMVVAALADRGATPHDDDWQVRDFAARELADGLWLATYELEQDRGRVSRRSTLWRREGEGWKAEYHQGTLI
jgi:hypothetical protein